MKMMSSRWVLKLCQKKTKEIISATIQAASMGAKTKANLFLYEAFIIKSIIQITIKIFSSQITSAKYKKSIDGIKAIIRLAKKI